MGRESTFSIHCFISSPASDPARIILTHSIGTNYTFSLVTLAPVEDLLNWLRKTVYLLVDVLGSIS